MNQVKEKTAPALLPQTETLEVPLVDLRAQYNTIRQEVIEAMCEVAGSATYVLGPKVANFERDFASYVGAKHCIAVNSGTSALHLALIAADVRRDDEILTVPMTFIATAWGISYLGAKPVFVDVDAKTYTMDVRQVEKCLTRKTKALLPVHLYGLPADMEPLMDMSRRHGIPLIEDAAQAHGAKYRGQTVGTFGLCGCFSFYPGKNLGAYGEAGAVVTDDERVANRLRALRDHAQQTRYHHEELGFNYRMDALQGAILGIKLKHLERWTEKRRELAERYQRELSGLPLKIPVEPPDRRHVWHLFVVLHPKRDEIRKKLEAKGVQSGLHYPLPLHLQKAYEHLGYGAGAFPVAEQVANECLTLPLFAEMTVRQQGQVIAVLKEALQEVM